MKWLRLPRALAVIGLLVQGILAPVFAASAATMTTLRHGSPRLVDSLPSTIPFVGPETLERQRGETFQVRVGANESAFGVSPKAAEAMREAVANIAWYNDPEAYDLRSAIAARHGVSLDEVLLGAGIDEMLGNVVRMVIEPGMPVVTSLGAYPTFNYHVAGFGGVLEAVPYRDDRIDLEALLDAVRRTEARLVYLANPDNPMGTWHDAAQVRAFIDDLSESTLLVLDEAYIEFAPASAVFPIDADDPRVIRMRTFSKAHGMAGARIGYAIAPSRTIGGLGRIRNHFGVNRIAQAGALASLGDAKRSSPRWSMKSLAGATSTTRSLGGWVSPPCRRRPTSSPSTPATTATMPVPFWRGFRTKGCSCACPESPPSTGAFE